MRPAPQRPRIYHITHVDNLARIASERALLSDRAMCERGGPSHAIGMSDIKRRRIDELEVPCHPGTKVGDYVPFFFCPRSVMLYVIHRANHPALTYRDGQGPIVHLEADLDAVVAWAQSEGHRWAFSFSNAGSRYAEFSARLEDLSRLDWAAIASADFRGSRVKEAKQAEFLLYGRFPFDLVERIGVCSEAIRRRAEEALTPGSHRPAVELRREWYY